MLLSVHRAYDHLLSGRGWADRMRRAVPYRLLATAATLFFTLTGWAIFRSESPAHLQQFLTTLFGMSHASALEIPAEVPFTLILGAFISLLPATPLYPSLLRAWETQSWLRGATIAALAVVYVLAIARAVTVPFQPFIYFRF